MFNFIALIVWFTLAMVFYTILFSAILFAGVCACLFIFSFAKEVYYKLKERYKNKMR